MVIDSYGTGENTERLEKEEGSRERRENNVGKSLVMLRLRVDCTMGMACCWDYDVMMSSLRTGFILKPAIGKYTVCLGKYN